MAVPNSTVIVPVYNDPEGVRVTLDSLVENTHSDPEIIVVDNNSSDETPAVIHKFTEDYPNIHCELEDKIQSSYAARNTGIKRAKGNYLVFLDADVEVPEGWLQEGINELVSRDGHYMGCDVEVIDRSEHQSIVSQYNQQSAFPIGDFIEKHGYSPTVCLFTSKELLEDIGTFDERLISTGDLGFGNRAQDAGYELHYTDRVTIRHPARTTLESLIKRNFRIGRGHCQLQKYHPGRYGRPGVPPRPTGISDDQFDSLQNPIWKALDLLLLTTRGMAYYYEYLRYD